MNSLRHLIGVGALFCVLAASANAAPRYVATIHPVTAILAEVAKGRATVETLLPPGASPHTYEPRPSDVQKVAGADVLFHVSDGFDGWVVRLSVQTTTSLLDLLPDNDKLRFSDHTDRHSDVDDPHFWFDPRCVLTILPALVNALSEADPNGHAVYARNAERFAEDLEALDEELAALLRPVSGKPVFMFHPSFRYMVQRYGLVVGGVIEPAPGKEPTPRSLQALARTVSDAGAKAIFTEPQLPAGPVRVLAEATGAHVFELDPIGGREGRRSYAELLRFNATVLRDALK